MLVLVFGDDGCFGAWWVGGLVLCVPVWVYSCIRRQVVWVLDVLLMSLADFWVASKVRENRFPGSCGFSSNDWSTLLSTGATDLAGWKSSTVGGLLHTCQQPQSLPKYRLHQSHRGPSSIDGWWKVRNL